MALTRKMGAFTVDVQDEMAIYSQEVSWTDPLFGEVYATTVSYQVNKANPDRLTLAVEHLTQYVQEAEATAESKLVVMADSTTIPDDVAAALEGGA